jgi:hypothetical protein
MRLRLDDVVGFALVILVIGLVTLAVGGLWR